MVAGVRLTLRVIWRFNARALQSSIEQTYSNMEMIVVDDKSEDKSVEIVKQFWQADA